MLVELQKHKTERKSAPFDVRGFISAGRSASTRRNLHFLSVVSFETPFFTTVRVLIYTFIHSSRGRDCNYLSTQVRDGDDMRGYIICVIIVALRASLRCGQQKKMQASSRRCGVRGIV